MTLDDSAGYASQRAAFLCVAIVALACVLAFANDYKEILSHRGCFDGDRRLSTVMVPPFLKELVPGGFEYGANLLVEFDSDSVWYETSLTIAAGAIRAGIKIDYHNFQHTPDEIRKALDRRGLDVKKLEDNDMLWIVGSYTVQTGVDSSRDRSDVTEVSVKLSDWSIALAKDLKAGISEAMKRRLHIDDNTGILLQY